MKQWLLNLRDQQYIRVQVAIENGSLEFREVLVPRQFSIQLVPLGSSLLLIARIRRVVDIKTRHLVETHHPGHGTTPQMLADPVVEHLVARVVGDGIHGHDHHIETQGDLALPAKGIHPYPVSATLAFEGNPHEVPLQATKRKVFVHRETEHHAITIEVMAIQYDPLNVL